MNDNTHTTGHDENGNLEPELDEEPEPEFDDVTFWNEVDLGIRRPTITGNGNRARRG